MVLDLNYEILLDEFESKFKSDRSELDKIDQEMSRNNQRLQNAQHLLLDAELSAKDYKDIKIKIEGSNEELNRKKENLSSGQQDFREHLKHGATILRNIDKFYEKATLSEKQLIIGSVFPEKLIFEKDHFRTKRMNEAVVLMCLNPNELGQKKSGRSKNFSLSSTQVGMTGFEPATSTSRT